MKRKIISASLLPFLALTTYGAYTVTERLGISDVIDNIQSRDTSFNNEEVAIEGLRFVSRGFYLGDLEAETELVVEGSKSGEYDIEYDEYDLQIDYSVPGVYTITATIKDWDGVVIGKMTANKIIFENTFYQADEIWDWYEENSHYDYNGTPRPVKIKEGVTVPIGFSHSWPYVADGDEIQPWPTEGGLEGKELNIYYQGPETGGKKALVLYGNPYNIDISKVTIDVSYPNILIFTDQLPYEHKFTYKGDLDIEQVRKAPFKYRLDNKATGNQSLDAPLIDGKAKKQYTADVVLSSSSNFSNVRRIVSIVSVIDRMDKGEVTYDGNDHMAEAKAIADKIRVPGVTVSHQYKNSNGDVVTEMIKGGVYTIEATYSYNGAEPIIDTTTFTIKKGTYDANEQKGVLEYNGSEQTLGVDLSQLPAGVKIKAGSPVEVKGKDVAVYTEIIQMDGGETYEDFEVKVTLEVKQAVIPSITLNNKEVFYNGNTHAVAIEEILPDEVKVTYSYSKDGTPIQGEPIDSGVYTVTATIVTGDNYTYTGVVPPVTLTIKKAKIEGLTLPSSPVVYDGQPKSLVVEGTVPAGVNLKYTYTDKDGNPIQGAPTNAGIYNVTVTVEDKNYYLEPVTATFEIKKATITGLTLSKGEFDYAGVPHPLKIKEALPSGATVVYGYYENGQEIGTNAPIDAGNYIVKAFVDRGSNYEPLTLEAELKINQVEPAVDPNEMEVVYTGEPITIELAKELSYEANIEYVNNVHTDAGTYQGKAIITGGRNYKDIEVDLTLVITKAPIEGLTLPSSPVVYDGQSKSLVVEGTVPAGVDLIYTYTDKDGNPIADKPTDAGTYNVTVTVEDKNYVLEPLKQVLEISKATLAIAPVSKSAVYSGQSHNIEFTETLPSGVVVEKYESNIGVDVGKYQGKAIINGGNNYNDTTVELTLEITPFEITGLTLPSSPVVYDGQPKSLVVEGTVPAGVDLIYTYTNKDGNPIADKPTDAGTYNVTVTVEDKNYVLEPLKQVLEISKATLVGKLEGKTVTYDGTPQGITVEGVPVDFTEIEYTYKDKEGKVLTEVPTDAGEYTVEAIVKGGTNYEDKKFTTTVTISKAVIPNGKLESKTVTYDGIPQGVTIEGVPVDFTEIEYTYKDKEGKILTGAPTDAGEYAVEAIVKGGKNYEDLVLTTTLKINKANITGVSFIDKVVAYNKAEQFIEITGALPTGVTVVYEKAKQTEVGIYETVARIVGGTNYNDLRLTARFEIKEDRTPSKDAEIFELVINGVVYKKPGQVIEHMLRPTPYEDITDVDVVSFTDYSSLNVPEAFTVDTRDPKVYYKDITVTSEDGKTSKTYTLKLIKPIEDRLIILQKFQNTLLINNNPSTNGGYAFVSYQWFRNGVVVSTKQSYSVGQAGADKLNPNDYYYLIVKTTTGEEIYSTRIDIYEEQSKEIKLYPNPVSSSDMTTNIMVDYSAAQFEKGRVEILTPDGRFIYRQELTIGENRVVIPTQLSAGIYLAVVDINGKKQTIRFSVK